MDHATDVLDLSGKALDADDLEAYTVTMHTALEQAKGSFDAEIEARNPDVAPSDVEEL